MSLVTLAHSAGRSEVLALELTMPLQGPWFAQLQLADDAAPVGAVVVDIGREVGEPTLFRGTVRRGGSWQGRAEISVVGGGGGLVATLPPREYVAGTHPVTTAQLVQDIATAAREVLAEGILEQLARYTATRWMRAAASAAASLRAIGHRWGLGWRILQDGSLWMGAETWQPELGAPFRTQELTAARIIEVRPDAATLRPGIVLFGRRIDRVTYRMGGEGLSAELSYEATP